MTMIKLGDILPLISCNDVRIVDEENEEICLIRNGFRDVLSEAFRRNIKYCQYLYHWGGKRMILYVVHGNTYYDGYGHIENIFGIYTKKDEAEAAKDLMIKELYEKEIARGWMSVVEDVSDIEVEILEIEANKITNIELGGYCE